MRRWTILVAGPAALLLMVAACKREAGQPIAPGQERPRLPEVEFLLWEGSESLRQHSFERALAFADSAEALQPELADIPFLRGRVYSEMARLREADSLYRIVIQTRPDYPGVWHNLGNTAFRLKRYTEAIEYYKREIETHGGAPPWRGLGRAYVELGLTDSARSAFEQAIKTDSKLSQAHFSLALLLDDLGDLQGALASARRASESEPDNPEYRYYMASYLLRAGRSAEAIEPLRQVIEAWPWHQGAHYNMAQALMRLGHTEEARLFQDRAEELRELQAQISHHENTVRVQPTNARAHAGLGTLLRRAGRYNDAMHAYRVALFLDPSNLDYRHNVAVLHLLRADTLAAVLDFEAIVRADSTSVPAWINLGSLYAMSGDTARARRAWTTALRLEPDNEMAAQSLEMME